MTKEEKWKIWLRLIIDDSIKLHTDLEMYKEFFKILENNKIFLEEDYNSDAFIRSIQRWFASYALILFRKHLKPTWNYQLRISTERLREISFSCLLLDIYRESKKRNPLLGRGNFAKKFVQFQLDLVNPTYRDWEKPIAEKDANDFFNNFAGPNGIYFNPWKIYKDYLIIKKQSEKIETCADKAIAHTESQEIKNVITWKEFEEAINLFHNIVTKYSSYFLDSSTFPIATHIGNWKWIFSEKLET